MATTNNPYWISYTGSAQNDGTGGVSIFSNGDIANAVTKTNSNGTSSIQVDRLNSSGTVLWSVNLDADYSPGAGSILVGANNNVYIVGGTKKGVTGESSKSDSDVFATSLSPNGELLWYKNYGVGIHEIGSQAVIDKSGDLVLNGRVSEVNDGYDFIKDVSNFYGAEFSGGWRGFQLKIDSDDGSVLKGYTTGSYNSGGELIAVNKSSNTVFVGGYTFGSVNGVGTTGNGDPAGANKYLIARSESNGEVLWTRMENWIRSNVAVQESEDAIYFVDKGVLEKVKGSTGETLWSKSLENKDYVLAPAINGGVLISEGSSAGELTINRIDSNGATVASQLITHQGNLYPGSFTEQPDGSIIVSGTTSGNINVQDNVSILNSMKGGNDAFILKIDSNFSEPLIPTYTVTQAPTPSVAEGATLTTSVQTTELTAGTEVFWSAGGTNIDADDFTAGALSGTGTVGADGRFSFTHSIKNDNKTEGNETLQVKLYSDSARSTQVGSTASTTITDSSKTPPTYTVTQAPTPSVAEGATLTTSVQTTELTAGTEVFWSAGGTNIDADDFTAGALSGTGTVGADGRFSFTHSIKNDNKTEGNETLQVKLYSDSARSTQVGSTASTTITDSSKTPPTYTVTQAPTPSVAEGATLTTSVQTTELTAGTEVFWSAGGTNIDADDFTAGALSGTGTVGADGRFSFTHSIKNDNKTEGNETLQVKLYSDSARSTQVGSTASTTITDSSKTPPTYTVTQAPTPSVAEGATLTTSVQTTELTAGTEVFWSAGGTNIDADDFTAGALSGTGTVGADGRFSFTHSIKNDNKTEGNETLQVKLYSDSARSTQVGSTASTTITDSSKTPPTYTVTQAPTPSVAEGATLTTSVQTTELTAGTEVFWSAGGTNIDADDFTAGALSGTGTVGADGRFSFTHSIKNDNKTEGNETLQVKLYSDSARSTQVGSTASTTITDSSKTPPTYTVTQAPTPSVAEGATLTTSVQTTELTAGTEVFWSAGGTNIDADDFTAGALSGTGTVGADGRFSFTHSIKNDNKTEGNETLQVKLYSDSARSTQVGSTASTTITDSSKTPPTYTVTQAPTPSVAEGATLTTSVQTTELTAGTEVFWSAGGTNIDADDFTAGALSGTGTVGADGRFSFTHSIKNDNKTEGNETLQVKLYSDSARSTQVGSTASTTITDSSKTPPTYTVTQAPTPSVAEGATLTTSVQTTELTAGTEVFWSAGGTNIDADDFTAGALSGTGTVGADGRFSFTHSIKNDNKTEGNETLQVKLYSDSARSTQVGSTASTTITDSSKTPPTYTVTQAPTPSVAEGATLTTSVQTTELTAGTEVFWSAGGTNIDADDFTAGALSGTGTVGADGRFSFTHSIKNDNKTEGNETLQVKLYSDSARSTQVGSTASTTITDSSKTPPTYTVTQAPTPSVAEGATLTTSVQTTELAEGTNVFWSAGGTNIDADDFTAGALSGTGTVGADGRFSFTHSIKNDNKTEGNETLQVKLYSDSARSTQVGSTASTTITDSSKTPPTYTVTQAPTPSVAEGATLTTSVQTTELTAGTEVFWSAGGTNIDADDFTAGALSGTGTVGADGRFSFTHSIKNDNKTEGNETLQVKLYSDSARSTQVGSTASTTITDSSKTPPTYSVTQSSNSINEGGTLNTTVKTTDLAVGTKVYWSADGTRIDAKDFSAGALSGEGIVGADGTFTFSHTLAYDNKTEGNENLQIKLYSDSARTSQVGNTSSTTIVDTSRNSVIVTKQEGDAHAGINEDLPRGQSNVVGIKATSLDVNGNGDFISDVDSTSTADATTGNGNASTHVRQSILGISISDSSRIGGEGKFSSIITHDSANSASANNGTANVEDHLNTVGIDVSTLRVQGKSTFSSFMSTRSQNSADATQTNDENISTNVSASLNRNQLLGEPNIVGMRFDRLTLDNKGVFTSQLENTSDTGAVSIKGDASTFSNNSVLGIGFNGASRITGEAQVTSLLTQRSFSDAQSVNGTASTEDHHSVIGIEAHDLTVSGNATFSSTVVVRALSNSGT